LYSRKQKNGTRRRNCECRQCHYRFLTVEDGDGERFLGQVMHYPPEELARITKNYYQLVGTLTLAKLPADQREVFNAALINTKMRLNIQGGKAGLPEGRNR
jgi:hypothetical protein